MGQKKLPLLVDIERLAMKMRLRSIQQSDTEEDHLKSRELLEMEFLAIAGAMNVGELCGRLAGVGQSTVSSDLKSLRKAGFVERQIDENDERVHVYTLTELGLRRVQKIRETRIKTYDCLRRALPTEPAELDVLEQVVQRALEEVDRDLLHGSG